MTNLLILGTSIVLGYLCGIGYNAYRRARINKQADKVAKQAQADRDEMHLQLLMLKDAADDWERHLRLQGIDPSTAKLEEQS